MKPSDILKIKKKEVIKLAKSYEEKGIFNIRIFGSVARGEDSDGSDIDFIVTIEKGKNGRKPGLEFFDFAFRLEEILGVKVDLISETSCPTYLKKTIDSDAVSL